jgi:1-acyl-sn-glycerol-3-phosphate acyltransferase
MPKPSRLAPVPGWSLEQRNPQALRAFMVILGVFYTCYFRVQTRGWQHIPPQGPVMLIGSHNGGLGAPDMWMMMYDWLRRMGPQRSVYGLMHPSMWKVLPPSLIHYAEQLGAVMSHPKMAIAALRRGASVLIYPGGPQDVFRPHCLRHKICLENNQAFIKLALEYEVPIVPLISQGAHDTLIVLADFYPVVKTLHEWGMPWLMGADPKVFPLYLGLPWGLALGPLPNLPIPIPIHTQVCAPIVFERYGRAAARDRAYVAACYQRVESQMQAALDQLVAETAVQKTSTGCSGGGLPLAESGKIDQIIGTLSNLPRTPKFTKDSDLVDVKGQALRW